MPRPKRANQKTATKLVNYIKKDKLKKFKACVNKQDLDLPNTRLPKGRTLLHCAAKHGCGYFIQYLLDCGVEASYDDFKGDLPLHLALDRALRSSPQEAAEVYNDVVVPLLKIHPDALYCRDHRGVSVEQLLATLNRFILRAEDSDSESSDSDSEYSSYSSESEEDDWAERLAKEFDNESADFMGRYNYFEDFAQEQSSETYREWAERMGREMHGRRRYQFYPQGNPQANRKRKHTPSDNTRRHPKPPKTRSGINAKEEIYKFKTTQNMERQRELYEERFQAVLKDKCEKKLSFGEIPWPGRGGIDHVMEVLFGDKAEWSASQLKKYVREQQVRWHPDKFLQKFIDKIAPKSFEKVMERVKEISQALNKKAESLAAVS